MNATRLSICLALFSMLSTSAIAGEQSTTAQEEAEQLQSQEEEQKEQEGDIGTEVVIKQVWPRRTEEFPTYWFVRTSWKVHNPHSEEVQVRVYCDRYGYDVTYRIPPDGEATDSWGCEGRALKIFNNAPQYTDRFVFASKSDGSFWFNVDSDI